MIYLWISLIVICLVIVYVLEWTKNKISELKDEASKNKREIENQWKYKKKSIDFVLEEMYADIVRRNKALTELAMNTLPPKFKKWDVVRCKTKKGGIDIEGEFVVLRADKYTDKGWMYKISYENDTLYGFESDMEIVER